tara:strand:- start:1452 stop:2096 length:645 start_codon:yes stop_codon:yes gene_type:complete
MKKLLVLLLFVNLFACNDITKETQAQVEINNDGEPEGSHTSTEWKIWAYSTAAPSFIASGCKVMEADGTVLREGTNGWTAMPGNPRGMSDPENGWKDPHEAMPMVMDAQAMKWAMAFMSGKKPELDHDGWMYMLHGDMGEDNTKQSVFNKEDAAEGHWIESGPHIMLMPKDPSSLKGLTSDFNSGGPYIMFEGTGYDHVMIPLEGYYDYQPQKK